MSVLGKEDWKGMFDLVTNAKQVVSSVQDVARKLTSYTKLRDASTVSGMPVKDTFVSAIYRIF